MIRQPDPLASMEGSLDKTIEEARLRLLKARIGRARSWFSSVSGLKERGGSSQEARALIGEIDSSLAKEAGSGFLEGELSRFEEAVEGLRIKILDEYGLDNRIYELYRRCEVLARDKGIKKQVRDLMGHILVLKKKSGQVLNLTP